MQMASSLLRPCPLDQEMILMFSTWGFFWLFLRNLFNKYLLLLIFFF
jgi:hypothetical protein